MAEETPRIDQSGEWAQSFFVSCSLVTHRVHIFDRLLLPFSLSSMLHFSSSSCLVSMHTFDAHMTKLLSTIDDLKAKENVWLSCSKFIHALFSSTMSKNLYGIVFFFFFSVSFFSAVTVFCAHRIFSSAHCCCCWATNIEAQPSPRRLMTFSDPHNWWWCWSVEFHGQVSSCIGTTLLGFDEDNQGLSMTSTFNIAKHSLSSAHSTSPVFSSSLSSPMSHWLQSSHETVLSSNDNHHPIQLALGGGAENGQFIYVNESISLLKTKAFLNIVKGSKIDHEEIVVELDQHQISGCTLADVHILVERSSSNGRQIKLKTIKSGMCPDLFPYANRCAEIVLDRVQKINSVDLDVLEFH